MRTSKIAFMGLMLAVIMILTILEHMLPPLPLLPPNVKLGLSNVVTMYCVFFIGKKDALMLAFMKSFFVFLTRGPVAGILSLSGGLLSIIVIILLISIFKDKISYIAVSIAGALCHNLGQFIAVSVIMGANLIFYYLPILIVSGVVLGVVTGTLLKIILPVINKALR